MIVEHVELLVEEPSIEAALRLLLPRLIGDLSFEIYPHQCKDELLMRLPQRLRGYAAWIPATWRIVVVLDRDDDDCAELKARLAAMAMDAGFRVHGRSKPQTVIHRIAIEELEAWYFGDWRAVRIAYPRTPATIPSQSKYRDPDTIAGGTWEAFERVLQRAGYFAGGLRKLEAARAIAQHMDPPHNTSPSFRALRDALMKMQ
jgi:hypothetical protein